MNADEKRCDRRSPAFIGGWIPLSNASPQPNVILLNDSGGNGNTVPEPFTLAAALGSAAREASMLL